MFCKLNHPFMRTATLAMMVWLAGCASMQQAHDDGALQREAMISRGTGKGGRWAAARWLCRARWACAGDGAVTFNFENQPVQAVVKAILGDLLKQNYAITPGVTGNISFSTSEPVDSSQALPILETLLSWTHNALVKRAGGYVVLPEKEAVAGNMVPSLGGSAPQGGLQSRLFPLRYISATEMQKLIKPFARADAVLLADPARNLIVMSGTPEELANYSNMVRTFDVDWLRGMSVGVFNLQYATANAMVVISTQPQFGATRARGEFAANMPACACSCPQRSRLHGDVVTHADFDNGDVVTPTDLDNGVVVTHADFDNGDVVTPTDFDNGVVVTHADFDNGVVVTPTDFDNGDVVTPTDFDNGVVVTHADFDNGVVVTHVVG
ncbi:MAG: hypothetical protein WDW36_008356 [Sanguina aurantia]